MANSQLYFEDWIVANGGVAPVSNTGTPTSLGPKTSANSMSVTPATDATFVQGAGENHVGEVGGNIVVGVATFTRPADTTAYAVKDVVSDSTSAPTVLTFSNAGRVVNGTGYITKARISTSQKTNVATYRLWIYNAAPTAINDNSPFTLLWSNVGNRLGYIDFNAMTTEDATNSTAAESLNTSIRLPYICAGGLLALYAILETTAVFTPDNAQQFHVTMTFDRN